MRYGRGMSGAFRRSSIRPTDLSHELHQDARDDERVDDGAEREETRDDRDHAEHESET